MSDQMCKAVIELANGDRINCAQFHAEGSRYCYYHGKQMNNPSNPLGCPNPTSVDDPERVVAYYDKSSAVPVLQFV